MPLTAGTRLGPYEIQSPLGAGGMGEVYRARDTRLDRTVAIKILPETLAADPQFRERFDREARTISQLDHPHICALYDVGQERGTSYLVMQYLEGETLEERLEKGALPLDQALSIAIQVASALDAAHRAGIVHRDVKPGNVMLTKAGAKLLDFGLAKASAPAVAAAGLTRAPTIGAPVTAQGTILGTFQYMAPEQLEGKEADARTDIFAFGAVLYEMLTGRKAFVGDSQASIIAAILRGAPAPPSAERPELPPLLDHIVAKCLAKDPDERWQSVRDLGDQLRWAGRGPAGREVAAATVTRPRRFWPVATFAMTAVAAATAALHLLERPPSVPEMQLEITTPATSSPFHFAVSPDGRHIVYVAGGAGAEQLWLRSLTTGEVRALPGTEGAWFPFWSPDSRSVGFFAPGRLYRTDIEGGRPVALANVPAGAGGSWSAHGTILYAHSLASPLMRIPADGGTAESAMRLDASVSHRLPHFLPDGRHFLFYNQRASDTTGVYFASLDGGEPTLLAVSDSAAVYLEPDWVVYARQGALVAHRLDLAGRKLIGNAIRLSDAVGVDPIYRIAGVSASRTGLLAYRAGGAVIRQLVWLDRSGNTLGVASQPDAAELRFPELSPDGRRIAVDRTTQDNQDVWLIDSARGGISRFTFDPSQEVFPLWSPDGSRVVFGSSRKGPFDLYMKPSSGAGAEEVLREGGNTKLPLAWSSDGRVLLYFQNDPKTGTDLWALDMSTPQQPPRAIVNTPFDERHAQLSPDGRWVAYSTNESGRFEVVVQPFPDPTGKWQVSTGGGSQPRWRPDGGELYFIAPDATLMAVSIRAAGALLEAGIPEPLFPSRIAGGGSVTFGKHQYAVSRDGRFLINQPVEEAVGTPITMVVNWEPTP